jgi:hypothetical protein
LNIERYRDIDDTSAITLNTINWVTDTSEFKFSWPTINGAEEYDFEWTWIDATDSNKALISAANITDFNFRNASSRVTINANQYKISKVYEQGYLVARSARCW